MKAKVLATLPVRGTVVLELERWALPKIRPSLLEYEVERILLELVPVTMFDQHKRTVLPMLQVSPHLLLQEEKGAVL